ncbi:hypothetical protein ACQPYK_23970 [Streptosporangium sp. CA-135522]
MGYLDFLDLLLEEELAVREERRLRHASHFEDAAPQDLGRV